MQCSESCDKSRYQPRAITVGHASMYLAASLTVGVNSGQFYADETQTEARPGVRGR